MKQHVRWCAVAVSVALSSVARGLVTLSLVTFSGPAAANEILVIPDLAAAYLYDQAGSRRETGNQASLALIKEGSFKEYLIESNPPGFICDENCGETAQNLPEGKVTLRIVGKKPVSFLNIPLTGKWSGACDHAEEGMEGGAESARCVVHLSDMTEAIRVEVSPNVEVGTLIPLPEGGQAMIVKVAAHEGYVTVAGHQQLGSGRPLLTFDETNPLRHANLNSKDTLDGRANMPKLLAHNSEAAQYCAELNGGDWYLPAKNELGLMTPEAMNKISDLDMSGNADTGYVWSSTQNGSGLTSADPKKTITFQANAWLSSQYRIANDRDAYNCTKKKNEDGYDCKNIRRYQVLCFRRLSI